MNEIIEKMLTRHAIRRFQPKQIEEDLLEQIIQAGLYAPSAGNNQRSRIVVCQDQEINERLGRINRNAEVGENPDPQKLRAVSDEQPSIRDDISIVNGFYNAPTVVTFFVRDTRYAHDDAAFMAENMWLAAHFLGLSACYIGRAKETSASEIGVELREQWGIPEDMVAVGHLALGYCDGPAPHAKSRRDDRVIRV